MANKWHVGQLGIHACRLAEVQRKQLIMEFGSARAVPPDRLGKYLEIITKNGKAGAAVKTVTLTIKKPRTDDQATRMIDELRAFELMVERTWTPQKDPLPTEGDIRHAWVKRGWYFHDAVGGLHWKKPNWHDEEFRRDIATFMLDRAVTQDIKPWDLAQEFAAEGLGNLLKSLPGPLRALRMIVRYGNLELGLEDLTRFRMPNNFYKDPEYRMIYVAAIAHSIARFGKVKTYTEVDGLDIQNYGHIARNFYGVTKETFLENVHAAIEMRLLPPTMEQLIKHVKHGRGKKIDVIVEAIERRVEKEAKTQQQVPQETSSGHRPSRTHLREEPHQCQA